MLLLFVRGTVRSRRDGASKHTIHYFIKTRNRAQGVSKPPPTRFLHYCYSFL